MMQLMVGVPKMTGIQAAKLDKLGITRAIWSYHSPELYLLEPRW